MYYRKERLVVPLLFIGSFLSIEAEYNDPIGKALGITKKRLQLFENVIQRFVGNVTSNPRSREIYKRLKKLQEEIPDSFPFPCNVSGDRSVPTSVHLLRPEDISIVGAIGDSLTAGTGVMAARIEQILVPNRGASWSIGGEESWRKITTLPNILKEFNPSLMGYSLGESFAHHEDAWLNVAEPLSMSEDLLWQAQLLLVRLNSYPKFNITEHWKLITIMIGANDFCTNMCFDNHERLLEQHRQDLFRTLEFLMENFPRSFINVVPAPNLRTLFEIRNRPPLCKLANLLECPCLLSAQHPKLRDHFETFMKRWQRIDEKLANDPRFEADDFAVVYQPFLENPRIPLLPNGDTDLSFLAVDCFHISQKMSALASINLWNNMLEPEGQKYNYLTGEFKLFKCPSEDAPYLFTRNNSQIFFETGRQW